MNNQPTTNNNLTETVHNDNDSTVQNTPDENEPESEDNDTELLQPVLTKPTNNYPFGDLMTQKQNNTIRIYYKNINGISTYNSWNTWDNACKTIHESSIDILGTSETNVNWNEKIRHHVRNICQKYNKTAHISTSSSIEQTKTTYQPGGTATLLIGNLIGRSTGSITDNSGMGRWSGFRLKTNINNQHLNVLTVYCPTKTMGIHTCYQQQCEILKEKGNKHPDPRQQLLDDLAKLINQYNRQNDKTIIMMDANEGLYNTNSKISTFLAQTQLIQLINNPQYYPPTHKRGSQCIDFIFGSPYLQDHIHQSGITPYFEDPYPLTDHRGLFIDIDTLGLFGASLHTPLTPIPKRLSSLSKPMILKFIYKLEESNNLPSLLEKIQELNTVDKWEYNHHEQLELIDKTFTQILLSAEENSALPTSHPWSPEIDTASLIYSYWLIVLNGKTSKIDTYEQLEKIQNKLKDIDLFQSDPHRRPIAQMRIA
jgi:hypothetical protein